MSEQDALAATGSQTVGPFFHFALTAQPNGRLVERLPAGAGAERIVLRVRVTDGDGAPVSDAMVELSQSGAFARLPTGEDGACEFETRRPPNDGRAAGHIHVCLFARGLLRHLHTRIYFAGDRGLDADPVLALVPTERRGTLLATPDAGVAGRWIFALRLQGADETVFFDV